MDSLSKLVFPPPASRSHSPGPSKSGAPPAHRGTSAAAISSTAPPYPPRHLSSPVCGPFKMARVCLPFTKMSEHSPDETAAGRKMGCALQRSTQTYLDAFVVESSRRRQILMPSGTNNDLADRTRGMATASAVVNSSTAQDREDRTKHSTAYRKKKESARFHKVCPRSSKVGARIGEMPLRKYRFRFDIRQWSRPPLWVSGDEIVEETAAHVSAVEYRVFCPTGTAGAGWTVWNRSYLPCEESETDTRRRARSLPLRGKRSWGSVSLWGTGPDGRGSSLYRLT